MAKRLKRTSKGSIILPSGERITPSEQKALRSAVSSANRKARNILAKRPKNLVKTKYNQFSEATDWLVRKKHLSYNKFKNKKEFQHYLSSLNKITSGQFEKKREATYIQNYKKALRNAFNSKANNLIRKINKLDKGKLSEALQSGELEADIGYIYSPEQEEGKYNQINSLLDSLT